MDGWQRKSLMHLESACKGWTICKVMVGKETRYELWRLMDKKMLHGAQSVIDCVRRHDELKGM